MNFKCDMATLVVLLKLIPILNIYQSVLHVLSGAAGQCQSENPKGIKLDINVTLTLIFLVPKGEGEIQPF